MINTLQLKNFKGFQDQRIEFDKFSVVIGRNNAGKSSAFEAIRILSNVVSKFSIGKFTNRPSWLHGDGVGILPPIDDQQRKPETLFFRYEDPPAIIAADFANGCKVEVFIGTGGVLYAEALTPKEQMVDFPNLLIQIGPEPVLAPCRSDEIGCTDRARQFQATHTSYLNLPKLLLRLGPNASRLLVEMHDAQTDRI